jgi:hypothetical protein
VAQSKNAVEAAIAGLLLIIGEQLAEQTLGAEKQARDLRHKLTGLSRLWISRGNDDRRPSAIRMGQKALALLNALPANSENRQTVAAHDPGTRELVRWQLVASSLLANAEAEVD